MRSPEPVDRPARPLDRAAPVRRILPALGAGLSSCVLMVGCMVGPDYTRPGAPVNDAWLDVRNTPSDPPDADPRWWRRFGDPTLDALVEQALGQNLTLREAGLRVIQARARRGIAAGQFFPQTQSVTGGAANNQISKNSAQRSGDRSYSDYSVGLQAAWELDFWGRFRRGIESADAALDASVADYDSVLVLVASEVASNYVLVRSLQEQLVYTRQNVTAQRDTIGLSRLRFEAGAVSELDVTTAQATLANTQALIPQLEDSLRQTKMALCLLLGRTPSDLESELAGPGAVPVAPPEIAIGIPADLLRRRPDVRRAERTVAALSAQIGVASADLYPSITISGATGFATSTSEVSGRSPGAGNLLDADSFEGFIGLGIDWPILNYGRIKNNIRVADARYEEAVAAYRRTVLQAAGEVESGLSSFLRGRERVELLAQSVASAERSVELSLLQYRGGAADFLRVNQAQVDLVERQNNLVIARAGVAQGAIATYLALGGGWETGVGREFVPRETVDAMRSRTDWGDILAPGGPAAPGPQQEIKHDNPR